MGVLYIIMISTPYALPYQTLNPLI